MKKVGHTRSQINTLSRASAPERRSTQVIFFYGFMVKNTIKSPLTATNVVVQAVNNVKPCLEVRKVRKSGRTILVPRVVPKSRQEVLAMRWIIESARQNQRKNKLSFSECLADELFYAFQKKGQARQKRDELHKIAQTNRAFLRFRW